jgi:branched-chain amino acid transport system substrate-binding protein
LKFSRAAALALLVVLPLAGGCDAQLGGAGKADVVIGADLELSGANAAVGGTYQRALQLKVDEINAAGGVLGGRKLQLRVKDNRTDPGVAVTDITDLAGQPDVVALVVGSCADCLTNAAKTINNKGIPTISLAPAAEVAEPVTDRRFIFKVGPNPDDGAVVLATQLKNDHVTTVSLLTTDNMDGDDAVRSYGYNLPKVGVTLTSTHQFRPTDTDLSQPVHAAATKKPDALLVSAFPAQAIVAARTARDAGFTGRIYFDQTAAGELFLTGAGAAATNGVTMVGTQSLVIDDVIATTPAKVARKQWFNDYTAKYGNFSGYSTFAADAVQIIAKAVQAADGDTTRGTLRDVIETTQFEALSGQIRITPNNHSGLTPQALTLLVAIGGRWRLA